MRVKQKKPVKMTVPLQWEICFKVLEQCHFDW
nr:MAG TPA: hypothetical protein [Caudoviricetes sp.]